jgi:hypothetical protein
MYHFTHWTLSRIPLTIWGGPAFQHARHLCTASFILLSEKLHLWMIYVCADGTRFVQDSVAKQHSVSCFAVEFQFLTPVIKSIYTYAYIPIHIPVFLVWLCVHALCLQVWTVITRHSVYNEALLPETSSNASAASSHWVFGPLKFYLIRNQCTEFHSEH